MAALDASPSDVSEPRAVHRRARRIAGWSTALAVVVLAAASAFTWTTGVDSDPRLANTGILARRETFLGTDHWPGIISFAFLVVAVALLGTFGWLSARRREMHQGVAVMLGVAALVFLDPLANWATYAAFDPRFVHFPTTWPYVRLAPLVEPVVNLPGYPMYVGLFGLAGYALARVLIRRAGTSSYVGRHVIQSTFLVGFAVGFLWDVPAQFVLLRSQALFYSQSIGPVLRWENAAYPIVVNTLTAALVATAATLFVIDESGRPLIGSAVGNWVTRALSRRPPSLERRRSGAMIQILGCAVTLLGVFLIVLAPFVAFRVLKVEHPTPGTTWPYPETKTYDPYGDLARGEAGGPFYS
jgi:hypothetical protein